MTQALSVTPSPSEYQTLQTQAEQLVKSGFLPASIKTAEQALAIILTGRELNIPAMASLNTINVIKGKPTISPQLMLALIERSGQLTNIEVKNVADGVTVTMKRKGRSAHTETFGKAEAQAMGLAGNDNYRKQAFTMYKWRAVAACARVVFPDIILGLYTPDEMGATVNEDGEYIEGGTPEPAESDYRGDLIAYCGDLFRKLNVTGYEPKWNGERIMEYINQRYDVTGGIQDLLNDDIQDLAVALNGMLAHLEDDEPLAQE